MTKEEIRAYRERLQLTPTKLGEALDVAGEIVSGWESGGLQPEHPAMLRLALEQLEFQHATSFKGELGQEIQQRLEQLQQSKAELQAWAATNQSAVGS
jgi:hypothetical protein